MAKILRYWFVRVIFLVLLGLVGYSVAQPGGDKISLDDSAPFPVNM